MRKISIFVAALVLVGIGAWSQTTNGRVGAAMPIGTDPLHMMENAKGLSQTQIVDCARRGPPGCPI